MSPKNGLVVALILLPLLVTAVLKYAPLFTDHPRIASIAVMATRFSGPANNAGLADEVQPKLRATLSGLGITIVDPGNNAAADATLVTALTVDSGIVQLNVEVVDVRGNRVLFNTPYQSSLARYPEMLSAAAAALERFLKN